MTEIRTTSSTGGEKGMKAERFDLIPVEAMAAVARHYAVGAQKYSKYGECTCAPNATSDQSTPEENVEHATTSGSSAITPNTQSDSKRKLSSGTQLTQTPSRSSELGDGLSRGRGHTSRTDSHAMNTTHSWQDPAESAGSHPSTSIMTTAQGRSGAGYATGATSAPATSKAGLPSTSRQHSTGCGALTIVSSGDHNWRKGYEWSKSYAAAMRHLTAFWSGEDIDPETGSPHPAAVVFHMNSLLVFMDEHSEFDDRYKA